jgi:NAD+ synthase (glutamine-hydrolysing)
MRDLVVSVEVCEDLWAPIPQGAYAALAGATVIVNCSASNDGIGKYQMRQDLMKAHSSRLMCGYVYANAGGGESTTDSVFGGHNLIVENGQVLAEANEFKNEIIYGDLDIKRLAGARQRNTTFRLMTDSKLWRIPFDVSLDNCKLDRKFPKTPFVPMEAKELEQCCKEALQIQALGLKKRLEHTGSKAVVIGVSGGLDSTLALLVVHRTFELLGRNKKEIVAVTMPGFGTTKTTYENGVALCKSLGVTLKEISIEKAVLQHLADINHDAKVHDVVYENAQARERTQILMDLANQLKGLVIGTGSMSELALGWTTYNGDHMSMYGVNVGVPKTLIKHLIRYEAGRLSQEHKRSLSTEKFDEGTHTTTDSCPPTQEGMVNLNQIVESVLETPISPELLPSKEGSITQKTEDVVGPYKLHDFFMYYMLKYNYSPGKIYRIAVDTFNDEYEPEIILKWLKVYYTRFFSQQFKRSCMPDGPSILPVSLSPRGSLKMPSDACGDLWLNELKNMLK